MSDVSQERIDAHLDEQAGGDIQDAAADWYAGWDEKFPGLAAMIEADYQRRERQMQEWWARFHAQQEEYRKFEAETERMMNEMGW